MFDTTGIIQITIVTTVVHIITLFLGLPTLFLSRVVFDALGLSVGDVTIITATCAVLLSGYTHFRFICRIIYQTYLFNAKNNALEEKARTYSNRSYLKKVSWAYNREFFGGSFLSLTVCAILGGVAGKAYFLEILNTEKFLIVQNSAMVVAIALIFITKKINSDTIEEIFSNKIARWIYKNSQSDNRLLREICYVIREGLIFLGVFLAGTLGSFLGGGYIIFPILIFWLPVWNSSIIKNISGYVALTSNLAGLAYTALTSNFPVINPMMIITMVILFLVYGYLVPKLISCFPFLLFFHRKVSVVVLLLIAYPYVKVLLPGINPEMVITMIVLYYVYHYVVR